MPENIVLVVHCVDTEGPIGGDVRRRPDGSPEFMDNWPDIEDSIRRLTSDSFRQRFSDSFGNPYIYNWFIMDFMGFSTNPKQRVMAYHDTYDHFRSLPTEPDGFYWHYHHPPADGRGDQWSDNWNSSGEYMNILLHRLVEREDLPEAFRAGGTIEDNACSLWLEENVMVDYSNRVSHASHLADTIFDFNWFGAPDHWGYYHPSHSDFLQPGNMRRFVVRSVDLWSRLHTLTIDEVRDAFATAQRNEGPIILSYFSHDHRDMHNETVYATAMIQQVSLEMGVPWQVCKAVDAVQLCEGMRPTNVNVQHHINGDRLFLAFDSPFYQKQPFIGARMSDKSVTWLVPSLSGSLQWEAQILPGMDRLVVGVTSLTGNKTIYPIDL